MYNGKHCPRGYSCIFLIGPAGNSACRAEKKYRMRTRARKTRDNEKRSFNFISLSAKANARQKKVSLK